MHFQTTRTISSWSVNTGKWQKTTSPMNWTWRDHGSRQWCISLFDRTST